MTDHLRPTAPIAAQALLPGDPGRALTLAQNLLEQPRMANHARGLWGYTAATPAGMEMTIQSTGLGGPSIAIVLAELAGLGLRRAVRLGTCHALTADFEPGEIVVTDAALPFDGTSTALGDSGRLEPDAALTAAVLGAAEGVRAVTVASTDLYYDPAAAARRAAWLRAGASVGDLGTGAALAVGRRVGVSVASALVVARDADGRALGDEQVEAASLQAGRIAVTALERVGDEPGPAPASGALDAP